MRVQDIMTSPIEATAPGAAAEAAWQLMKQKRIRHLVVREGRRLVGVLSSGDVGGVRGGALRRDHTVADLMTPQVVTVPATTTVRRAANVMRGQSVGSLIVTANGRAVGIITVSDLLDLLGHGAGNVTVKQRPVLSHRVPHRKQRSSMAPW